MRTSSNKRLILVAGLLVAALVLFGAVAPALAAPVARQVVQPTLAPIDPDPIVTQVVTQVIPDTGDNNNTTVVFPGWTIALIVGVLLLIVLIALLARGSGHTHVE